ncbi:transposase, partial [Planctomycetota bacterium]
MSQKPRIKVPGHAAAYHVVTRTNGHEFRLDDYMKEHFIHTLKKLKSLYYVNYCGYSILENHYHLLVNLEDPEDIDPHEAIKRWNDFHDKEYKRNASVEANRTYVVQELTDISSFMKRLNVLLTNAYNRHTGKTGTLWEKRYFSNIIERGMGIIQCGAYIELNSFRASLSAKPEDYNYSSINHIKQGNPEELIDIDLLEEGLDISSIHKDLRDRTAFTQELFSTYLSYIYEAGTSPHKDKDGQPEEHGLVITAHMKAQLEKYGIQGQEGSMLRKGWEYSRGKFIGGEEFAQRFYEEYIDQGYRGDAR